MTADPQPASTPPDTETRQARPTPLAGQDRLAPVSGLLRTANFVRGHLERTVLRDVRLTWTGYDILQLIVARRPIDTRTIAKVACVSKATVTLVSSDFVQRALIRRDFDPADTRRVRLHPTPAAWQLAIQVRVDLTTALSDLAGQPIAINSADSAVTLDEVLATWR